MLALLSSALDRNERPGTLKSALNFTFRCTIFPVATITCALFWVLYAIEPELVMPHWVAQLIPAWLNHVTHTLPIVYVMGELLLFDGEHPARRSSMSMAFMHIFIYFVIIYAVRVVDKYWLYPLLELLSVELHVVVFIVSVVGYYWLIKLSTTLSSCFRGMTKRRHPELSRKSH